MTFVDCYDITSNLLCSRCLPGYYLIDGICNVSCPAHYVIDSAAMTCHFPVTPTSSAASLGQAIGIVCRVRDHVY